MIIETIKSISGSLKKISILKELEVFIPPSIETRFNSVYLMVDKFILNYDKMTNFAK